MVGLDFGSTGLAIVRILWKSNNRRIKVNKHYKIYADVLEDEALQQFDSAMALDTTVAGALMPDAHKGYSLPIGGVVATSGMIYPSWVGYDIGCGMCAVRLDDLYKEEVVLSREEIFKQIYNFVPVGFKHFDKPKFHFDVLNHDYSPELFNRWLNGNPLIQLGTLGGGNHFIEIGYDEEDAVWVVIHSGSRNFGWKTAQEYMILASGDGKAREGHYGFQLDSENGLKYYGDMSTCLEFALENRKSIVSGVLDALYVVLKRNISLDDGTFINRNHNHAEIKKNTCFGDIVIHRKGATHAETSMSGVIPGNMRDGSFVVVGKGCKDSLWSSSHGAGRILGRKEAKRTVDIGDFTRAMVDVTAKVSQDTLDESPFAYKNIFDVMELQKDLVSVVHHIKPIVNIKG